MVDFYTPNEGCETVIVVDITGRPDGPKEHKVLNKLQSRLELDEPIMIKDIFIQKGLTRSKSNTLRASIAINVVRDGIGIGRLNKYAKKLEEIFNENEDIGNVERISIHSGDPEIISRRA